MRSKDEIPEGGFADAVGPPSKVLVTKTQAGE